MSKVKYTPMTQTAASRIASATATQHGGKIPAKSFASRADASVQRSLVTPVQAKGRKNG